MEKHADILIVGKCKLCKLFCIMTLIEQNPSVDSYADIGKLCLKFACSNSRLCMCLTNSIWAGEFHLQKTLMKMLPQHDFLLLLLLSHLMIIMQT